MCVHVCVYMSCVCMYVYMYVCACMYVHVCVYMYVCACMCVHELCVHVCTCMCVHVCVYMYVSTCMCYCMWVGESPTQHVYDVVRLNKYLTIPSCMNVLLLLLDTQSTHTCLESSCSIW